MYFLCTCLLYPSTDVIKTDILPCHLGFSQKARKCSMINKRGKDWPGLGYSNIKKNDEDWQARAELCEAACSWCSFIHQNHTTMVLLGAGFKAWPMPKLGLKNIYFSQANPTHLVLVFFSKSPVLPSMSFREFLVNQCHSSSSWNGIWESAMNPLCPATSMVRLELSGTAWFTLNSQALHAVVRSPWVRSPPFLLPPPPSPAPSPHIQGMGRSPITGMFTELLIHFLVRLAHWHMNRVIGVGQAFFNST